MKSMRSTKTTDSTDESGETRSPTAAEEKTAEREARKQRNSERMATAGAGIAKGRNLIAQIVWIVFVLAALTLAVAALLITVKANGQNDLVKFVYDLADKVDLGLFDLKDGLKEFARGDGSRHAQVTKTALFNYGIGAVVYLIVGRILDRVIRP